MTDEEKILWLIDQLMPVFDQYYRLNAQVGGSILVLQGKLLELKNQACAQTCEKPVN